MLGKRNKALGSGDAAGFTLLEVMMAMVLFFGAVPIFTMTYLNTLDAMSSVQLNQGLEQDLEIVRRQALLLADAEEFEEGGEVLTGEHGLARWDAEYEATEIADLFKVSLTVQIVVQDEDDIEEREIVQTFYLTRPSWSDPVEREELRTRSRERLVERQTSLSR